MTRIKAILAAGTLTGVVLAAAVGLGVRNITTANTAVEPTAQPTPTSSAEAEAVIAAQQAQLETMLAREEQYRAQIEAANQSILALQEQLAQPVYMQQSQPTAQVAAQPAAQPTAQPAPAPSGGGQEREDDEHEEHEDDGD